MSTACAHGDGYPEVPLFQAISSVSWEVQGASLRVLERIYAPRGRCAVGVFRALEDGGAQRWAVGLRGGHAMTRASEAVVEVG